MRNNEKRLGIQPSAANSDSSEAANSSSLSFVSPTEFVELPSRGRFYPEGHPLRDEETIEIKFMTAKEEDLLSSETLIKKGLVIDRLLRSILVNQDIDPNDLLVGDRNAIMVAARISSYGALYDTKLVCPSCLENVKYTFDLRESSVLGECFDNEHLDYVGAHMNESGNFAIKLPVTEVTAEVRLLTGHDEQDAVFAIEKNKDNLITGTISRFLVSVNGETDPAVLQQFVQNLPAADSIQLRRVYATLVPNLDLKQEFYCSNCAHREDLEVPLNAEFFWPG